MPDFFNVIMYFTKKYATNKFRIKRRPNYFIICSNWILLYYILFWTKKKRRIDFVNTEKANSSNKVSIKCVLMIFVVVVVSF